VWEGFAEAGSKLARALEEIARADAGFSPKQFLDGARIAYEMIVGAFAEGDRRTLKNLLSSEVYEGFSRALDEREQRGEKLESNFIGIEKANIADAALEGRRASVTVRFVSQLITATRNREGAVVDGDPKRVREVTDIWTFIRDVTFSDPNWKLGATESAA
jgi:predicted lipid-binding transport protein (Tim44 family)